MNKVFTSIRTPEVRVNTKIPNVVAETLQKGRDGISIKDAYINEDNRLVIKLTDNTEYELGVVVGKDGYTPQKGIDYLNDNDIAAIVSKMANTLNFDDTLNFDRKTNTLSVNTAKNVEQDNTKPVTSAAVYTVVGNINAILESL